MRILASTLIAIGLAALPASTISAEPKLALRAEGYVGYSDVEIEIVQEASEDAFQGGGTGSVSAVFDQLYLQADVFGNVMEFDRDSAESVGAGAHVGWRDPMRGSAGIAGTYTHLSDLSDNDSGRAGFEGELFLDRLTLAANAGYFGFDDDAYGYADAGLAFYPIDRARLHLRGGVFAFDDDDPTGLVGAGGEILVVNALAAFARWEASIYDSSSIDIQQHSIVFGVSLYWGAEEASLLNYDRTHFKSSCGGYLLVGRIC